MSSAQSQDIVSDSPELDENLDQDKTETPTDANPEDEQKDKVSYDTYKKLLGEKKKRDAELSELSKKLKSFEEKELEQTGKHSELIDSLRSQLKEKEETLSKLQGDLEAREKREAWNTVSSQIKEAALKEGCINPDKLLKLFDKNDLKALEVVEESGSVKVHSDDLKRLMEKARKENDFLFKKSVTNIADVTPKVTKEKPKTSLRESLTNIY